MTNNHVCGLKKTLYGVKQAPRTWYGRIDNFLMRLGFTKSKLDPNLCDKDDDDDPTYRVLMDTRGS